MFNLLVADSCKILPIQYATNQPTVFFCVDFCWLWFYCYFGAENYCYIRRTWCVHFNKVYSSDFLFSLFFSYDLPFFLWYEYVNQEKLTFMYILLWDFPYCCSRWAQGKRHWWFGCVISYFLFFISKPIKLKLFLCVCYIK